MKEGPTKKEEEEEEDEGDEDCVICPSGVLHAVSFRSS